jgi:hypothetical protein
MHSALGLRFLWTVIVLMLLSVGPNVDNASSGRKDPRAYSIPPIYYPEEERQKAFSIQFTFKSEANVELTSVQVVDGPARMLEAGPRQLRLLLVENGRVTKRFYATNPTYVRIWDSGQPKDQSKVQSQSKVHHHKTMKVANASAHVTLPFSVRAERLHLYDEQTGRLLASVGLVSVVQAFCKQQPEYPDCDKAPVQPGYPGKSDLLVKNIRAVPGTLSPGTRLGPVSITIANEGSATALGGKDYPDQGYVVDVLLTHDLLALQKAVFQRQALPDNIILSGSRLTTTPTLSPGEVHVYTVSIVIPDTTAAGEHCLAAFIDSTYRVEEGREGNNILCVNVKIRERDFDGDWEVSATAAQGCALKTWKSRLTIKGSQILEDGTVRGQIAADGSFQYTRPAPANPNVVGPFTGKLQGETGTGTYRFAPACIGSISLKKL